MGSSDADVDGHPRRTRPPWRAGLLLFFVVLAIYGSSPVVTNGDSFLVVPTAHSLITQADLNIAESLGPGTDGGIAYLDDPAGASRPLKGIEIPREPGVGVKVYDYFPWLTAVAVTPLVAVFELPGALGVAPGVDVDQLLATGETGLLNLIGGSVLAAGSAVLLAALAWTGLAAVPNRQRRGLAIAVGLVTALGTPLWSTLSRALWSQTTAVLFLSLAVFFALRLAQDARDSSRSSRRLALFLGTAVGLSYVARPTSAIPVLGLGVWLALCHRRALLGYVGGGAAVAAVFFAVNLTAYGQLQPPYFEAGRAGLGGDTVEAIFGNLISPNRGLLVFSSVALLSCVGLWLAARGYGGVPRGLAAAAGLIVVAHLVVVSGSGEDWFAGSAYGPRFMADAIPFLTLLALPAVQWLASPSAPRSRQAAAIALVVLSVAMHAPGAWSKPSACWSVEPVRIEADPGRVWDWSDLQATRGLRTLLRTGSVREAALGRCDDALDVRALASGPPPEQADRRFR